MTETKRKSFNYKFSNLYDWYWPTTSVSAEQAEYKLLRRLSFFDPLKLLDSKTSNETNLIVESELMDIGEEKHINTLAIKHKLKNTNQNNLVMTHGFGVGLGIYYKNYEPIITQLQGWNLYSIDWLGMGRSTRSPFNLNKKKDQSVESHIEQAENFFVESLESWRQKNEDQ